MASRKALGLWSALVLVALVLAGCGSHSGAPPRFPSVASVHGVVHHAVPHAVGVQVAIEEHGRVVLDHGYGYADLATKRRVRTDTRFAIGSVTKQVTAALVLQQVGAGKVALDARLATALPDVAWPPRVTVRELLQQTSGLSNQPPTSGAIARGAQAVDAFIAAHPTRAAAGTEWFYNNNNYLVAGDILEHITGRPFLSAASAVLRGGGGCDGRAASYDATGRTPKRVTPVASVVAGAAGGLVLDRAGPAGLAGLAAQGCARRRHLPDDDGGQLAVAWLRHALRHGVVRRPGPGLARRVPAVRHRQQRWADGLPRLAAEGADRRGRAREHHRRRVRRRAGHRRGAGPKLRKAAR